MTMRLGCAIWAYRGWLGGLYPPQTKAKDFLRVYSRRLSAVEGNAAFYAVPSQETLEQWYEATPPGFKFCPKLFRGITHSGALSPQQGQAQAILERLQTLGDRLGPIMIQLPPNYSPAYLEDLDRFLQGVPSGLAVAVEVRHPNWFLPAVAGRLNACLQRHSAGRILLDSRPVYQHLGHLGPDDVGLGDSSSSDPQHHSQRRKPRLPLQPEVTAPFTIIRYIAHPTLENNQGYFADWCPRIKAWLAQGTVVYLFIHCPQEARSPAILRAFHTALEAAGVPVPPLTWQLTSQPEQLSLF